MCLLLPILPLPLLLQGFFVEAHRRTVATADNIIAALQEGETRRAAAATDMNARSSRSHAIFRITVESHPALARVSPGDSDSAAAGASTSSSGAGALAATPEEMAAQPRPATVSTFNFVDLAGSEGVRSTGATGDRRTEGNNINKSLLALKLVVQALANPRGKEQPKWRDSQLTALLKPALAGHGKLAVICCVSTDAKQTAATEATLEFASFVKRVKLTPSVNYSETVEQRLRRENEELRARVVALEAQVQALTRAGHHAAAASAGFPSSLSGAELAASASDPPLMCAPGAAAPHTLATCADDDDGGDDGDGRMQFPALPASAGDADDQEHGQEDGKEDDDGDAGAGVGSTSDDAAGSAASGGASAAAAITSPRALLSGTAIRRFGASVLQAGPGIATCFSPTSPSLPPSSIRRLHELHLARSRASVPALEGASSTALSTAAAAAAVVERPDSDTSSNSESDADTDSAGPRTTSSTDARERRPAAVEEFDAALASGARVPQRISAGGSASEGGKPLSKIARRDSDHADDDDENHDDHHHEVPAENQQLGKPAAESVRFNGVRLSMSTDEGAFLGSFSNENALVPDIGALSGTPGAGAGAAAGIGKHATPKQGGLACPVIPASEPLWQLAAAAARLLALPVQVTHP